MKLKQNDTGWFKVVPGGLRYIRIIRYDKWHHLVALMENKLYRKYSFPNEKQATTMKSDYFLFTVWAVSNKTR